MIGFAQDVSMYTPGVTDEGVVYFLPKTEIELQVTVTRINYTPGEFCQYAGRYLRLTDISSQLEESWEIKQIKAVSAGVPDPNKVYAVKLKDKSVAAQVELTPDGIIKAINTTSPAEKNAASSSTETKEARINPRDYLTEEILLAGSTAKMAELVAKEIYNIRESKNSLVRGQADYMPQDGAALKLMLENLEKQEKALTQMFAGTTDKEEKVINVRVDLDEDTESKDMENLQLEDLYSGSENTGSEDTKDKVAFRFSQKLGVLEADNLAGEPYYVSVVNMEALPAAAEGKAKKKLDGIIYNIPGKAKVTVYTAAKDYFEGELDVTQFGTTETLVDNLFNKKINTRVIFNPNTGGIIKIDKDL